MADKFPPASVNIIAIRSAYRCSKPDHRIITVGPGEDSGTKVVIGVAAHITAASPGGPRYDALLTPEQRRHPDNGVWLCQNCGKMVDDDPARFPVELLRTWKNDSEDAAKAALDAGLTAPPPSRPDLSPEDMEVLILAASRGEIWVFPSDQSRPCLRIDGTDLNEIGDPALAAMYIDSLNRLVERNLALREGRDRYSLTGEGFKLARSLRASLSNGE